MSKTKNLLELQNQFWVLIIGIVLIVYGFYYFSEISAQEEAGQTVRMKKIMQYIYQAGGKYTILAMFEVVGLIALISGILQLKNKL